MPDSYGRAPLHNAILRSDARMVEILLDANADINLKDDREDTPIHFAARGANTKIIKVTVDWRKKKRFDSFVTRVVASPDFYN